MKLRCALLSLVFFTVPFATDARENNGLVKTSSELSSVFSSSDKERLILVAFDDRSINRTPSLSPLSAYRSRSSYQTTSWSELQSEKIAEDYQLEKVTEWPMSEVGMQCVVYKASDVNSLLAVASKMSKDRRIKLVQKLNEFKTQSHNYTDPYFKLQSNLQTMQLEKVHDKTTGRNITIGMIDTGVDTDHPDLKEQEITQENFTEDVTSDRVRDKHGTAIAGVMVARIDNGAGIVGIAPNASLVALKACWPVEKNAMEAVCNSYTLAQAVNRAIKMGVNVLNMSLSGPFDPILNLLLSKAIENGTIIVAADAGTASETENFPAMLENVISVRTIPPNHKQVSEQAKLVQAPGDSILTTLPFATYDFISGSSIAAAEVSGLAALLLELNPNLNYREVKALLIDSAKTENQKHFAGVNAENAVAALCRSVSCT